jgi:hypothetical protein
MSGSTQAFWRWPGETEWRFSDDDPPPAPPAVVEWNYWRVGESEFDFRQRVQINSDAAPDHVGPQTGG